jgi:ribonuclease BN (tRNA processing enzyme)
MDCVTNSLVAGVPLSIGISAQHRQKSRVPVCLSECGLRVSLVVSWEELDAMKLTVLGGSAAGPNPGQGCSGYLIESGATRVVMDLGPGTFPELRRHVDYRAIDGVVVSHCHLDHFLDVLTLRYALAYNPVPAQRRVPLWLPPDGSFLLDRMAGAISNDPKGGEFLSVFEIGEYEPDALLRIGELRFRFHPTVHYVPCWAMRISNGIDGDLFYTADTGPAANLESAAAGSHLIVAEGAATADSQEPYASRGHMTASEAGALAREAGATSLLLSHLWTENDPFRSVGEASIEFGGPVDLATPGFCVSWRAD